MKIKAIIFDVDGTIADTELRGHLPACNEAFKVMGLDIYWDLKTFLYLLKKIPGNANRLRYVLQTQFNYSNDTIENIVKKFALVKKEIYVNKYAANVPLREGIISFIENVIKKNIRLAVVTTSYEEQVHALFDNQLASYKKYFNPILGKESGIKTGVQGMLYQKCLDILQLNSEECLAIEDSESGARAAMKAKIPTIVTYNDITKDENFEGALLVGDSIHIIENKFFKNLD